MEIQCEVVTFGKNEAGRDERESFLLLLHSTGRCKYML